jgi:predicted small lipoprotein YifL|tara:strand:- start:634 stop:795 length:162 start_codon:yes stop_codon:yes gene_type:complete
MFRATSLFLCCLTVVASLALSGCGIKPSKVLPPEDGKTVTYPRTYPDPVKNSP